MEFLIGKKIKSESFAYGLTFDKKYKVISVEKKNNYIYFLVENDYKEKMKYNYRFFDYQNYEVIN